MAYKDDYVTGDTIDATIFNELVQSAVYSFTDLSTIQSSISSPVDGQIAFAQDTESYYRYDSDSASWVALLGGADITAVTINTNVNSGLSGGTTTTSGDSTTTLLIDANNLAVATAISSDYLIIEDVTDGSTKKALISDIVALGDITAVETNSNSGLSGGGTSGDLSISVDANNLSTATGVSTDYVVIEDVTDNSTKKSLVSDITSDKLSLSGGTLTGSVDAGDQELTKFVAKDYSEDIATTSDTGTSFSSNTLTLDVQDGNVFEITLDANVTTWSISNLVSGKATTITVILKQDSTGSRLMNATQINSTTFKTVGAGGLTLTTDASAIDIVTVVYDGTNYYVFSQLNLS